MTKPLTPKQARFVEEYLIDRVASAAYKRAGYQARGNAAEVNAARLLRNAQVAAAVSVAEVARSERTQVTADQVVAELARIGFSDMRRFARWGADGVTLLDSEDMSDDDARCVSEVSQSITQHGGKIAFKLHDKVGALTLLGKHLGMFTEKVEHSGGVDVGDKYGDLDAEALKARARAILGLP